MKNQALFSLKDKNKKLKCRLLQFLFGALRVKFCLGKTEFIFLCIHKTLSGNLLQLPTQHGSYYKTCPFTC